jgi:hypothetical protein
VFTAEWIGSFLGGFLKAVLGPDQAYAVVSEGVRKVAQAQADAIVRERLKREAEEEDS